MSYKKIELQRSYRSSKDLGTIVEQFYNPVLAKTSVYKRAVGYFSSTSLSVAAKGVAELIKNGGKMKLIASPHLEEEDIKAIEEGTRYKEKVIEDSLIKEIELTEDIKKEERLNYLAWLIAEERLEIKVVVHKDLRNAGIYHEKIGIMESFDNEQIAFIGSSNETAGGLINNFESIDVFCSWKDNDKERVEDKQKHFDDLWNNANELLEVMDVSKALKSELIKYQSSHPPSKDEDHIKEEKGGPKIPDELKLRDYQKEAITSWFKNNGQGLLEMATGTGKTLTAITGVVKLYEHLGKLAFVITCPYQHLVEQWCEDLRWFGINPIVAYSHYKWEPELIEEITDFNSGITDHFCVIMTNATFQSARMQKSLERVNSPVVFIADEAHHLGTKNSLNKLFDSFHYRLALSATPHRWFDEQGTEQLIDYFGGKIVFQYGLKKAIGKHLTEYYYHPHIVTLEEKEYEDYLKITQQLVKYYVEDKELSQAEMETRETLLRRRAKVIQNASNKIEVLKNLMENRTESTHNIFYCGSGKTENQRSLELVTQLLGKDLGMRVHQFTAEEDQKQRKKLLDQFESGKLQGLVAIKCLDEGVDVPATQTAYIISSSTNPREFIQRRGRVLRRHKDKKFAEIHDFIVIPRGLNSVDEISPNLFNLERKMLQKELVRFNEFASLALNKNVAENKLLEIKRAYNLMDM
ncbi:DEAD/DEAH box helicase family protein [Salimicrobium flavidum]|uniref:DNA phosphorothioation system restriction enzyme n=1 Tax=Salimicrobium flavidum TaxID=570947 RepID=A0A1N7KNT9_9BACI|nr:DEAD/DEAH box helicase family protein [Salimicrobium flavidum]SIS63282.1 DNA phosphorothioation system restriction enzyme [Salimicrobium flavidum]